MFRHEKRFENPPGLAILISDKMADAEVDARLKKFKDLAYERVGLTLRANLVALKAETGDAAKFAALAGKVKAGSDANIILMSDKVDVLAAGLKACADRKPLLYAATKDNADAVAALAKESGCAVAAKAAGPGRAGRPDRKTGCGRTQEYRYRLRVESRPQGARRPDNHQERRPQ